MRHLLLAVFGFGALALLPESSLPARAQVGNFGFGSSTAGASGGLSTGPSNLGGIYGLSSSAGSGGAPTGVLNPSTLGFGISTGGGPGATATGPTVPILPQFPATTGIARPVAPTPSTPAVGLPALGNTPGVVAVTPALSPPSVLAGTPALSPPGVAGGVPGIAPAVSTGVAPSAGIGASAGVAPSANIGLFGIGASAP
jgi:hypothetical protein